MSIKILRRTGELTLGHAVNALMIWGFDYVMYPFVIWKIGLVRGGVLMAALSFVVCLLLIWFYDWSRHDWLGIEAVKGIREYRGTNWMGRRLAVLLNRGDWIACVILSIRYDPFITTIYLRQGAFEGMGRRDWKNFVLSWVLGNVYWSLLCFVGVESLSGLWRWWRGGG